MEILLKRQASVEERFKAEKSNRNAFALIESYWLCYKISGDNGFLHKAYHTVVTMSEINFSIIEFYFLNVFFNIELGNFERASELMDGLKTTKGYYKNNDVKSYAWYSFLLSLLYSRTGKKRAAEKQYNILSEINDDYEYYLYDLLLGMLNNEFKDYEDTIDFISYSYKNGCRSVFIFYTAIECFNNAPKTITKFDENLFFGLVRWSLNKNIDIGKLIHNFKNVMLAFFPKHVQLLEEVYSRYPSEELLTRICTELMEKMDYSSHAFYYYKEAETKQLELPNIYTMIIKSACIAGDENISRYTVDRFLKSQTADRELLAFVFHLIITKYKSSDLLKEYKGEIMDFACESLRKSQSGRYYNSIYTMFVEDKNSNKDLVLRAEKLIYDDLFKFRLHIDNNKVKYIWISEKELKEMREYPLAGKTRIIMASGEKFSCKFLGKEQREIIETPYKTARLVENAGVELYKRFFNKGLVSAELLIALSNHYMSYEELPGESIDVFKITVKNAQISASYRMLVNATIGNYYASRKDYKRAAQYYRDVDENSLNDSYIEQMLMAYINGKDYDKAVRLIIKKAECISDRNLFYALKQIIAIKTYDKDIADVAYELTLKSWYDKALTGIVFQYYNGSREEWQALSRALSAMSVSEQGLDEIILKNAIWMHIFDKGSQSVFWRMYEMDAENALIHEYTIFCTYEIIVKGTKPEYETIEILEKIFAGNGDHFIAYALCHVYINHGITTFQSEAIIQAAIKNCKTDKLIFPIFKQVKDKKMISAYIESNQPFIYHGFPNKTIKLYYRIDGETGFKSRTMQYVKFGLYFAHIPSFYGETITYYFSEEMETGSITTKHESVENKNMKLSDDTNSPFYALNNALIYEQLFKYDMVEAIITERLKEKPRIKGWIL